MFASPHVTAPYSTYTTFLHCTNMCQVSRCKQRLVSSVEVSRSFLVAPDEEFPIGSKCAVVCVNSKMFKFCLIILKNGNQTTFPDIYTHDYVPSSAGSVAVSQKCGRSMHMKGSVLPYMDLVSRHWISVLAHQCINWKNMLKVVSEFGGHCCPVASPPRFVAAGSFSFPG